MTLDMPTHQTLATAHQTDGGRFVFLLIAVFAAILASNGCRKPDEIAQYQVSKPTIVQKSNPGQLRKTLGAIATRGRSMWFFKLAGASSVVDDKEDGFDKFVDSIRFDERQQPQWNLPEGWSQRSGGGEFRFATISVGTDDAAEMTVTVFPSRGDPQEFVLLNINRWRGQLQLPDISLEELKEVETKTVDSSPVLIVRIEGYKAPSRPTLAASSAAPPSNNPPPLSNPVENDPHLPQTADNGTSDAGVSNPHAPNAGPPADNLTPRTSKNPQLSYEAPEQWSPTRMTSFRKAAFEVGEGDKKVEITVIPLSSRSGTLFENVDRWRKELSLPDIAESELSDHVQDIEIGDDTAHFSELIGESATTFAIMLKKPNSNWFIKLKGNSETAAQEKERFLQFAKSIRIP